MEYLNSRIESHATSETTSVKITNCKIDFESQESKIVVPLNIETKTNIESFMPILEDNNSIRNLEPISFVLKDTAKVKQ